MHPITDNCATRERPKVTAWLSRHARFHVHFTPASSSWLSVIERFFRDLTEKWLRRRVFRGIPELVEAIDGCIANHSTDPRPFE